MRVSPEIPEVMFPICMVSGILLKHDDVQFPCCTLNYQALFQKSDSILDILEGTGMSVVNKLEPVQH